LGEKASQLTLLCLAFDVAHLVTLQTQFLIQLFHHRLFICAIIDRQGKWCSVEFIFIMAKRCADKMNLVLPYEQRKLLVTLTVVHHVNRFSNF